MAKEKPVKISVTTVFDGKRDGRQAFIDLILLKHRAANDSTIDDTRLLKYNQDKVFSDVRVS